MINARAWVSKLFSLETANFVLIPGVWTRYWFFAEFASPFQPQVGQIWSWLSHSQRGSHSIILKIKRSFHYWIHISQKRATYLTINICTYEFCPPIIFIANWTVNRYFNTTCTLAKIICRGVSEGGRGQLAPTFWQGRRRRHAALLLVLLLTHPLLESPLRPWFVINVNFPFKLHSNAIYVVKKEMISKHMYMLCK